MAIKFTPLHDRILVRRIEEAGTTRGGLIIPDSAKDKPALRKKVTNLSNLLGSGFLGFAVWVWSWNS